MAVRILQVIAALLLAALVGVAFFWHPEPPTRELPRAAEAPGGDFTLTSAAGPVALADLRGKVVLLYFGYTYCPDICPTALATAAAALGSLSEAEAARVAMLFISVDPARDSPAHLREYTAFFHPAIVGVTGSEAEVAAVAARYGVYFARQPAAAGGPPQAVQVRHQAETRPHDRQPAHPGRPVRRVGLHQLYAGTFGRQQFRELACLVGHAAGRRRQRPDDRQAQPLEGTHAATSTESDRKIGS